MTDFRILTDDVSVSPQIGKSDIDMAATMGVVMIINNRPDGEEAGQPTNDELMAYAAEKGIKWAHIPVVGGSLSLDDVKAMGHCLADVDGRVLAYCRSGTRSCTVWSLAEAIGGDMPVEEIIATGAGAGYDLTHMEPTLHALRANPPV